MLPYQQKIIKDHESLADDIEKLRAFILTDHFDTMDIAEQINLRKQHGFMVQYRDVLEDRMARF